MSVAYAVLAHKLPEQVSRLVRRLLPGGHRVVLHVSARSAIGPFISALRPETASGRVVFLEDRVAVRWADFTLVEAQLSVVRAALAAAPEASHVVLLSGQDYPIAPAASITDFFDRAGDASFMFASEGDGSEVVDRSGNLAWSWDGDLERLERYFVRPGRSRVVLPGPLAPWWPVRSMPYGLRPVQGSGWWALHRDAAAYLVEDVARRPRLRRFFRHTFASDENVAQMVLRASPYWPKVVQDDLHYIDWQGMHPKTLGVEDLDLLLASAKPFARKFDHTVDHAVLDELDRLHS